jgi:cytochrome c peroxidase
MIGYLDSFDHETAPVLQVTSPTRRDPAAIAAFGAFCEARCGYCHVPNTQLPFYATFPIAHMLVSHDVTQDYVTLSSRQSWTH